MFGVSLQQIRAASDIERQILLRELYVQLACDRGDDLAENPYTIYELETRDADNPYYDLLFKTWIRCNERSEFTRIDYAALRDMSIYEFRQFVASFDTYCESRKDT